MVDNYDLWAMHDAEQEREASKLPICKCCEEPIFQEEAVCIDDDWYCEYCEEEAWERVRKGFLKNVEI